MTPPPDARPARGRPSAWWLLLVVFPVVAFVGAFASDSNYKGPPTVAVQVPAGYQAIAGPDFGYAVPRSYPLNAFYSDNAGDNFYGDDRAWVGETLRTRANPPVPGEAVPSTSIAFGVPSPIPYTESAPTAITVPGADVSYRYQLSRPGGFRAVAIDTWRRASQTEMWLIVATPGDVSATVLATLRA